MKTKIIYPVVPVEELTGSINPRDLFSNKNYFISDGYDKHIITLANKIVENVPQMNFSGHKLLNKEFSDKGIIKHFQISESSGLLTREQIIWATACLTGSHLKGEPGFLSVNGNCTVLGYLLCQDGKIRIVYVDFNGSFYKYQWYLGCEYPNEKRNYGDLILRPQ